MPEIPEIKVRILPVGDLQVDCYIINPVGSNSAAVIDPGGNGEGIEEIIKSGGLELDLILITHGHYDHIGAVNYLRDSFPNAKFAAHEDEVEMLAQPTRNFSWFTGMKISIEAPDVLLADGSILELDGVKIEVLHVPGHSNGSVCFFIRENLGKPLLFCGDVLFLGSIGRTDFPGCSLPLLISGIKEKILLLPDNTVCYPGHGPSTTVIAERTTNPFIQEISIS